MQPEALRFLEDIYRYAADARHISRGRSLEEFATNKEFRYAIERCFSIVGEALTQLKKIEPSVARQVTDWQSIIRFRNILIHGYSSVVVDITWATLSNDVDVLMREVRDLFIAGGGNPEDLLTL